MENSNALKRTENDNRNILLEKLTAYLKDDLKTDKIGKEVQIPYQTIFNPIEKNLEINCYKQDICIYKTLFEKKHLQKASLVENFSEIKDNEDEYGEIVPLKIKSSEISIPHVIIETKYAYKNNQDNYVSTDDVLCYGEKARKIKELFPWCKYLFVVFGKVPQKVYKIGQHFDKIYSIEDFSDESIKNLLEDVKQYYKTTEIEISEAYKK